jgi:hypothetical protein
MTQPDSQNDAAREFADEARQKPPGILSEFVDFLRHNKKWWLAPIIIMLLLIGVIVVLGGTAAAPFIYPLL